MKHKILLGICIISLLLITGCQDRNEYWLKRFNDGQAEQICKDNGYTSVASQSPNKIGCKIGQLMASPITHFPRPYYLRDIYYELQ